MDITTGTRVESQGDPVQHGTVIGPVEGLDGFVLVRWDDGQVFEEAVTDVTVL